jgi:Transglutaminase-like superfamily
LFLSRLRSFARLQRKERWLALRAIGWLVLVRAGLALISFTRLRELTGGSIRQGMMPTPGWPQSVRRAVMRASRSLPGSTCLAQSLVAERLLRAGGCNALLSIGVAPAAIDGAPEGSPRASLDAHAWVESGGVLVTGDDPHERYELLATFHSE